MSAEQPLLRLSEFFRAFLAFICGILIFTGLAGAFSKLAGIEAPAPPGAEKPAEVVWCLAAAMLLTGYLAARIAGRWGIVVGAMVGGLIGLGAGRAHLRWQGVDPTLAQAASLLLLIPCALAGAWLASRMAQREARKRAEKPLQLPVAIRQRTVVVWLGFFLALGMTAVAVWAIRFEEATWLTWLGVPFFGGATLLLGWRGLRNTPQAILREDGIEFPAFGAVIPWSEIVDAAPHPFHPVSYVRFRVRNPERYLSRLTPLQHAISQAGEAEPNIGVALTGTPYTAEEICALVRSNARGGEV